MSIELRPLGISCNISCMYCYQNMQRDSGNGHSHYDLNLIKDKLTDIGEAFHLFGGEPLLMPMNDLRDLLEWEFKRYGLTTVVTNGVLINDEHINMFKNFNTSVGISIDGPEELNDIRWAGSPENTRKATAASISNINKLLDNNIRPSFQVQVTKCNSNAERLPKMLDWIRELDNKGIVSMRLHILEIDNPIVREQYAFTNEENIAIFSAYSEFERTLKNIRFDIFNDMKLMLAGKDDNNTCTWRACDPYTTEAVKGMDGEGRMSNCGLTDKEGINFQKPDTAGYERYIALYHTPQEYGGCHGCRFFLACKGQCPGTAINGDWRNKSENCGVWMHFFEKLESDLVKEGGIPLSLHSSREELEKEMLTQWSLNNNPTVQSLLSSLMNHE